MRIVLAVLMTAIIALFTQVSLANSLEVQTPECSLASEGIFRGSWVKHRIYVNEDVVYGANDMNSIVSRLENLRGQGLCR